MQRINEDIKNNRFQQMYLLYGEERYLKRQYRERLKNALCQEQDTINTHFYEGKEINLNELMDLAQTMPFFADRRVIFVDNSGLFKAGGEKLAEYLAEPTESTCFVFTEHEVDKRSRLYKAVQKGGYIAEFASQEENTLKRWVAGMLKKEGMRVTESTVNLFLMKTGNDMDNISMELEKLVCYCMGRDIVSEEDVEAVCTTRVSNHIFDMINAIADKQPRKALKLYYDLLALKEPPMRILFLLARQCNMLLQVKELKAKGFDNKAIGSKISLPPFVAGKYMTQSAKFRMSDLKKAVEQCVEAEEAVKTGRLNDVMSVEILIMSVFGGTE